MRDKERIEPFLKEIMDIWKYVDSTLGLFIHNVVSDPILYYLEDDDLLIKIKEYYKNLDNVKRSLHETTKELTLLNIQDVWEKFPDLRFGQLLSNIFRGDSLKEVNDSDLVDILFEYYGGI